MTKFFPWAAAAMFLLSLCASHLVHSMPLANSNLSNDDNNNNNDDDDNDAAGRVKRQVVDIPDDLDAQALLVFLCDGLQDIVPVCSSISTAVNSNRFPSFDDFNFPTLAPFPTPSVPDFGGKDNPDSVTNITSRNQTDLSEMYQLSSNGTDYPLVAIAAELATDATLRQCFLRLLTFNLPPLPPLVDDFLNKSTAVCPSTQTSRLFKYFSLRTNSTCFEIQNVEEPVEFRQCLNASTSLCSQEEKMDEKTGWDFSYNPFGSSKSSTTITTVNATLCITQYQPVIFYSFCPDLPQGQRIIRDRIAVPTACTPFLVPSNATISGSSRHW